MAQKQEQTFEEKTAPRDSFAGLHRSSTNKVIAGVAGGLGEYFDIDPTFIRIVFLLLTFFGGSGILIYIVLWIIMPLDTSSSKNPNEHIKENVNEFKEAAHKFAQDIRATRKNHNREDSRKWFGIIILVIGALFLLDSFGIYSSWYFSRLWPLILIVFGLVILAR